jgi:hypothetical protein
MSAAKIARLLLVVGLLLVLAGIAWPYILPAGTGYSNAQAVELNNASEALHETMHERGHTHGHDENHFGDVHSDNVNPEIAAAAKRYSEAQNKLHSAKFWTFSIPVYVRWSGLAVCAIGIVAYVSGRRK